MDNVVELDSQLSVAKFSPDETALQKVADAGFRSVVNFRTEEEKQDITPAEERKIVENAEMTYLHHPVAPDALDAELVDDFVSKLESLPRPVLFHCASGKRAGAMVLMALAAEKGLSGEAAINKGKQAGVDLSEEKIGDFVRNYADRKAE